MKKQILMAAAALALAVSGCADESAKLSAEELKLMWSEANGACRGDPPYDPDLNPACHRRTEIGEQLADLDWCYSSGNEASYLSTWRSCSEEVDNADSENTDPTPDPVLNNESDGKEASKKACYDYLYERAWDEGFNFEYHRLQTHENWKRRYGDNYIHQYIVRRIRNGSVVGDPFFKHCIVSKSSLEVLRVVNSDIGA
jgi:hypothetical protein